MDSIKLTQITPQGLADLISDNIKTQLEELIIDANKQKDDDDLLTRSEACKFLSINSSTLWAWTNQKRVIAYGISNRRYYKRSELLESLKQVKK